MLRPGFILVFLCCACFISWTRRRSTTITDKPAMPLTTPPVERTLIHSRDIICRGYRRADGLWDIEGQLSDTKTYDFNTEERGTIEAGDRIHGMWLRLTVDDDFLVHGVEAVTDHSPYRACPAVTANFQRLVGLSIGSGWTRAVKERLGGVQGCTHLVEMLGPLATVAFQTIFTLLARERAEREKTEPGKPLENKATERPTLLNMCHIMASDGEVARRHWPEFYTGSKETPATAEKPEPVD